MAATLSFGSGSTPELSRITLSSYNRQHPLRADESGSQYDPLVRDFSAYQDLFHTPKTVDEAFMRRLPLSLGLLKSFAVVILY